MKEPYRLFAGFQLSRYLSFVFFFPLPFLFTPIFCRILVLSVLKIACTSHFYVINICDLLIISFRHRLELANLHILRLSLCDIHQFLQNFRIPYFCFACILPCIFFFKYAYCPENILPPPSGFECCFIGRQSWL